MLHEGLIHAKMNKTQRGKRQKMRCDSTELLMDFLYPSFLWMTGRFWKKKSLSFWNADSNEAALRVVTISVPQWKDDLKQVMLNLQTETHIFFQK